MLNNLDTLIDANSNKAHADIFDCFVDYLNSSKIRYVIIRGFTRLPKQPYSDLDIVIHPDDFSRVTKTLRNSKYFSKDELRKEFDINGIKCIYNPFFTNAKKDKNIPNGCFRLDLHNHFFFFYKEKMILAKELEDQIFSSSIKFRQKYSIPSNAWEYFLMLYRCVCDLNGKLKTKHKNRINVLRHQLAYVPEALEFVKKEITLRDSKVIKRFDNFCSTMDLFPVEFKDTIAFVFWTKKAIKNFLKIAEKNKYKIIYNNSFKISDDINKRLKIINSIYEVKVKISDKRVISTDPITIIVIENNNPKYEKLGKARCSKKIKKIVNRDMFLLKQEARAPDGYTFRDIHGSDEIHESNKVFKAFNMRQYLNKETYVPIELVRGVIWKKKTATRNYDLLKIENTPHYRYLLGDKKDYIKYTKNIDTKHSEDKFSKLIKNFDTNRVCEDMPTCFIMNNGYYLIYDGLHRISILKERGYQYVKVKVRLPDDGNIYEKLTFDNIEI